MFYKLKTKRLNIGYTNDKMAKQLGISRTFYYQIESGTRKLSYEMAIKIADIFQMKPDDLFYDDYLQKEGIMLNYNS